METILLPERFILLVGGVGGLAAERGKGKAWGHVAGSNTPGSTCPVPESGPGPPPQNWDWKRPWERMTARCWQGHQQPRPHRNEALSPRQALALSARTQPWLLIIAAVGSFSEGPRVPLNVGITCHLILTHGLCTHDTALMRSHQVTTLPCWWTPPLVAPRKPPPPWRDPGGTELQGASRQ